MGEKTKIQWTDATVNFWHGCTKVSEGCKFCYMYRDKDRYGQDPKTVIKTAQSTLSGVFRELAKERATREAAGNFEPLKIFTCSWSDFFIKDADEWRPEAWDIIRAHPEYIWQILTKRPERIQDNLPEDWGEGWPNVWLGVSIENSDNLDRLATLFYIPAKVRFISFEPLLGPIEFTPLALMFLRGIQWAIIGGESGNETGKWTYRPADEDWLGFLMATLSGHNVPVFVKQLGTHLAKQKGLKDRHGGDWTEWPEWLKVREFPPVSLSLKPTTD